MAPKTDAPAKVQAIPVAVVGPIDVGRLIRELEVLDNQLHEESLRGGQDSKMPKTSKLMDATIERNKLNLLLEADRQELLAFLEALRKNAPVLHISFSADPSPRFIEKLMAWLRQEIHPHVLLTVGMQPNLGAGCLVRTTNKFFDLSLREDFIKKRDVLLAKLQEVQA